MVHYKRSLERLVQMDAAIERIKDEKRRIYHHLSNPPASALALFNADDRYLIEQTIADFFHGNSANSRDAMNLRDVTEMVKREETRAAQRLQDARLGFDVDQGPFLPKYLPDAR